jgi:hypothetical protein
MFRGCREGVVFREGIKNKHITYTTTLYAEK